MNEMGLRLRKLRLKQDLNINEVARFVGVVPSTYRAWELGAEIKGEPYLKLAEIYKVSLHELFTGNKSEMIEKIEEIENLVRNLKLSL